jgi:hypothetical protein
MITSFLENNLEFISNEINHKKQAKSKLNRAYYQKRKERERQVYFLVC